MCRAAVLKRGKRQPGFPETAHSVSACLGGCRMGSSRPLSVTLDSRVVIGRIVI